MKFTRSLFRCTHDKRSVHGTQYIPQGEKLPIVIVSHEFLMGQFSVRRYVLRFAEWGYAAFCYDFAGGGLFSLDRKGMTVWTEVEDLKAVIRYAASLPETDESRIILMGCSQGGLVSALTAAELGEEIEGLILFYPALCIPDDARAGNMIFDTKFDPGHIPDTIKCGPFSFSGEYPRTVMELDVFEELPKYKGKVFIAHGTADRIVDLRFARRAAEAYAEGQCELLVIPKAGHIFTPLRDLSAVRGMKQFLSRL